MKPSALRVALALAVVGSLAVHASEADRLAPTPADLDRRAESLKSHIVDADALAEATARVQNGWFAHRAKPCGPEAVSLATRARRFGAAHRDVTQSTRVLAARLVEISEAPTLASLVGPMERRKVDALLAGVEAQIALQRQLAAWQLKEIEAISRRCTVAELVPAPGFPRGEARAQGERWTATAVIGVGGGLVCPGAQPADGQPVVVLGSAACVATDCGQCEPVPVEPGAVVGASADGAPDGQGIDL